MEMRGGHGRTVVEGEPKGFDDETMGDDLIALADHLKLDRFHVLTHSTGGMIASRYAMKDCSRFASMVLTDTGSFTSLINPATGELLSLFHDKFAESFEKVTWETDNRSLTQCARPFFRGIAESDNREELLRDCTEMVGSRRPVCHRVFYPLLLYRPGPAGRRTSGRLHCPVLIIYGEKDDLFIQSSKLMAKEIPGAELLEYPGVGHMIAIEEPERFADRYYWFYQAAPDQ